MVILLYCRITETKTIDNKNNKVISIEKQQFGGRTRENIIIMDRKAHKHSVVECYTDLTNKKNRNLEWNGMT